MGFRIKRMGADVRRSGSRHYFGRIFATAVSILPKLPVYDTQCISKPIDRGLAEIIFHYRFISRWFFDVELIARIIAAYGNSEAIGCIFGLSLTTWIDHGKSKIKMVDFLGMPYELLQIRYRYKPILK